MYFFFIIIIIFFLPFLYITCGTIDSFMNHAYEMEEKIFYYWAKISNEYNSKFPSPCSSIFVIFFLGKQIEKTVADISITLSLAPRK